jgi:hypothetical protein
MQCMIMHSCIGWMRSLLYWQALLRSRDVGWGILRCRLHGKRLVILTISDRFLRSAHA